MTYQKVVLTGARISKEVPHHILSDSQLIDLGIRAGHLFLDQRVHQKSEAEKQLLKKLKKEHKKRLNLN